MLAPSRRRVYDAGMSPGRFLTSLVLASSLILVLPRGWCCIFAALGAKAPATRSCCRPAGKPAPAPQPRPWLVQYCPCTERNTVPADATTFTPDPGPGAWLLDLAPTPTATCEFAEPRNTFSGPPPPLLLNCVWLC
jgi:hypothetical protein